MKLKTRLRITFVTIILLPLLLTSLAFIGIGLVLLYTQKQLPSNPFDHNMMGMVDLLISRHLLMDMFIAMFLILLFTGIMLTRWINKGVIHPINELNVAMRKIKEGNFDYVLQTDEKGEIGDLYCNYEDMRLRLKESLEENEISEKQNRELISNISHDLKTPITAIKGYVEGIMDGVADTPEKMDKYIRTVYNKANDMERLING